MSEANMPWLRLCLAKAIAEQSAGAPPEDLVAAIEALVREVVERATVHPAVATVPTDATP